MQPLVIALVAVSSADAGRVQQRQTPKSAAAGEPEESKSEPLLESASPRALGSSSWSPWEVKYDGLQCKDLQPDPWMGLKDNWPKCWQSAVAQAAKLASEGNCKLCDVSFSGSKPAHMQSMLSQGCTTEVTCSAVQMDDTKTCEEGHGTVFAVYGLNDKPANRQKYPAAACKPCPAGCKWCYLVESSVFGADLTKFKCVMEPVGKADDPGGERCDPPSLHQDDITCGACSKRSCGGLGKIDPWCKTNDYKSVCDFPGQYLVQTPGDPADAKGALDYSITLQAGDDKSEFPPVYPYLTGDELPP